MKGRRDGGGVAGGDGRDGESERGRERKKRLSVLVSVIALAAAAAATAGPPQIFCSGARLPRERDCWGREMLSVIVEVIRYQAKPTDQAGKSSQSSVE